MKFIRTTATMVEKMRAEAKGLARESGHPLHECQAQVAKRHGFVHWEHVTSSLKNSLADSVGGSADDHNLPSHDRELLEALSDYFARLSELPAAPFKLERLRGSEFIRITIEGVTFVGHAHNDPYLHREGDGQTALGVSIIESIGPGHRGFRANRGPGRYICKYSCNEPRIALFGLSDHGVTTLAQQFGLLDFSRGVATQSSLLGVHVHAPAYAFFRSPAATALQKWCKAHPKLRAKLESRTDYLLFWHQFIGRAWPTPGLLNERGVTG